MHSRRKKDLKLGLFSPGAMRCGCCKKSIEGNDPFMTFPCNGKFLCYKCSARHIVMSMSDLLKAAQGGRPKEDIIRIWEKGLSKRPTSDPKLRLAPRH